jgi:glyoxylase-like metal-dependent hydrolase (beta-lactamase superfamily II)
VSPADGGSAALTYPYEAPPAPGTLTEVAPGIRWLRMPLPFMLDHINLWLLEDGEGWAIVDTGIAGAATRAIWQRIFAAELDSRPVTRIVVTHFHPDHIGLAGWLTERWAAPMWISETEWLWARMLAGDRDDAAHAADQTAFYRRAGLDAERTAILAGRGNAYAPRVTPIPRRFHRLSDGMSFAIGAYRWRVIIGRGHAPEHACLHCPELGILISGDQVLPRISPNVSVWPSEPDADPLSRFLDSLETLRRAVPDETLVLPSHNLPFRGLTARIDQLLAHHAARLADVEAACAEPRSALDIVPVLFRRALDTHQLVFAIGETLAHLHLLVAAGRLAAADRADGIRSFAKNG